MIAENKGEKKPYIFHKVEQTKTANQLQVVSDRVSYIYGEEV